MELTEKLHHKLKDLPDKPGVYIMRGVSGEIIYIGKAVVLKNRVRQYFFNTQKDEKVRAMVASVADFDYVITLSEKDALSLEANLVRKHKPRYNILLKDDRHNPYIRIDLKEKFPCIEITRRIRSDGARYFGPYFFGVRVAEVVDVLKSAYRVRCCERRLSRNKRECLNYHINLCLAPCQNKVSEDEYREAVQKAVAFLSGKDGDAEKLIAQKMAVAAETEEFERAIRYRQQLQMLKTFKSRALSELRHDRDLDAVSFVLDGARGAAAVVIVRGGKLMGALKFNLDEASVFGPDGATQFLSQYYAGSNATVPPEILLAGEFDASALEEYLLSLTGKKTSVVFPKIGIKKKILDMAEENARDFLDKSLDKNRLEHEMCEGACERLAAILGIRGQELANSEERIANSEGWEEREITNYKFQITNSDGNYESTLSDTPKNLLTIPHPPSAERDEARANATPVSPISHPLIPTPYPLPPKLRRIECYDISHLSGTDQVASGVTFIAGRPEKSEYRRYKIKTVTGADDYRCLAEVIGRRFRGQGLGVRGQELANSEERIANSEGWEEREITNYKLQITNLDGDCESSLSDIPANLTRDTALPGDGYGDTGYDSAGDGYGDTGYGSAGDGYGDTGYGSAGDGCGGTGYGSAGDGYGDTSVQREVPRRGFGNLLSEINVPVPPTPPPGNARAVSLPRPLDNLYPLIPNLPDLIVIDGGKGQLASAHAAMKEAGFAIPMIALAERDEEIYTLGSPEPIRLKKDDPALKLLQRIRDEAHRFAITYNRTLRQRRVGSSLEKIPGVGPKKRQILLKAFGSVRAVESAGLETLSAVEGIDRRTAEAVAAFFRDKANSV
ncbi:MAG: excinuclease ABC subunit UvrC [Firmicutes bacterium]|nr:excinuclease ABC subunit UvrC [Bacillota bacterium]